MHTFAVLVCHVPEASSISRSVLLAMPGVLFRDESLHTFKMIAITCLIYYFISAFLNAVYALCEPLNRHRKYWKKGSGKTTLESYRRTKMRKNKNRSGTEGPATLIYVKFCRTMRSIQYFMFCLSSFQHPPTLSDHNPTLWFTSSSSALELWLFSYLRDDDRFRFPHWRSIRVLKSKRYTKSAKRRREGSADEVCTWLDINLFNIYSSTVLVQRAEHNHTFSTMYVCMYVWEDKEWSSYTMYLCMCAFGWLVWILQDTKHTFFMM